MTHPRLVAFASDLLGDTVICRHSHFFCKLPGDGKRVSWHQDASYWPLSPSKVVSIWLAIDDSTPANGAMRVIPRSHRQAQVPFVDSTATERNVLNQTVRDPTAHGDAPVSLELKAGQISLHSDWILHGSEPNDSDVRTVRTGAALPVVGRARIQGLERAFGCLPGHRGGSGHWANHPRPEGNAIPRR